MIAQWLYASAMGHDLSDADIRDILAASRRNNAARGITGLLLVADSAFLQLVEGAPPMLGALEAHIAADPRHRRMVTILRRSAKSRAFTGWSMGFRHLDPLLAGDRAVFRATHQALSGMLPDDGALLNALLTYGADAIAPLPDG